MARVAVKRLAAAALVAMLQAQFARSAELPDEKLDEAVVVGNQARLAELRKAAEKAEDAFFERYNEVNEEDAFDVDCKIHQQGLFLQRRCIAAYVVRAQASDGAAYWAALKHMNESGGYGGGFVPLAEITEEGRKKEFFLSILNALKSDARLRALARDRENLEAEFQKARRDTFGKWAGLETQSVPPAGH
jgi:hypothetical protein